MPYVSRRRAAAEEIKRALTPVASGMAQHAQSEVEELIETSDPSGERYSDSELGRVHQASAPGEPPAIRTGEYIRSFGHTEAIRRGNRAVAAVTNDRMVGRTGDTPLWAILEYGTFKMAPRPHVRPAAERAARALRQGRAQVRPRRLPRAA